MRPGGTSKAWCAVLAARAKLLGEVVQVLEYLSNYVTRRNFGVEKNTFAIHYRLPTCFIICERDGVRERRE